MNLKIAFGVLCCCLVFASSAVSVTGGQFSSPINYRAGTYPLSVAIGDFNGDGIADIASANSDANSVSILLGKGDGAFTRYPNVNSGPTPPGFVTVADFNGDGLADLAVANGGSGVVSILLSRGDGSFQPPVSYGVVPAPGAIAAGDLNGDGRIDLAIANDTHHPLTGSVAIMMGNGDGTFQPAVTYSALISPISIVIADLNGDGKPDVVTGTAVVTQAQVAVSVLFGNGDGTFGRASLVPMGLFPEFVAVADFNGDGKLDIAASLEGTASRTIAVALGNGDGSFQPPTQYPAKLNALPGNIVAIDLNHDGLADIAVTDTGTLGAVSVLLSKGDGTFETPTRYRALTLTYGLAAADLNGDGYADLVAANDTPIGVISVLLNTGQ